MEAPAFFEANGYKNASSDDQIPFQYAWNTDDSYYGWMAKRPAIVENFNRFMKVIRLQRMNWIDW